MVGLVEFPAQLRSWCCSHRPTRSTTVGRRHSGRRERAGLWTPPATVTLVRRPAAQPDRASSWPPARCSATRRRPTRCRRPASAGRRQELAIVVLIGRPGPARDRAAGRAGVRGRAPAAGSASWPWSRPTAVRRPTSGASCSPTASCSGWPARWPASSPASRLAFAARPLCRGAACSHARAGGYRVFPAALAAIAGAGRRHRTAGRAGAGVHHRPAGRGRRRWPAGAASPGPRSAGWCSAWPWSRVGAAVDRMPATRRVDAERHPGRPGRRRARTGAVHAALVGLVARCGRVLPLTAAHRAARRRPQPGRRRPGHLGRDGGGRRQRRARPLPRQRPYATSGALPRHPRPGRGRWSIWASRAAPPSPAGASSGAASGAGPTPRGQPRPSTRCARRCRWTRCTGSPT